MRTSLIARLLSPTVLILTASTALSRNAAPVYTYAAIGAGDAGRGDGNRRR